MSIQKEKKRGIRVRQPTEQNRAYLTLLFNLTIKPSNSLKLSQTIIKEQSGVWQQLKTLAEEEYISKEEDGKYYININKIINNFLNHIEEKLMTIKKDIETEQIFRTLPHREDTLQLIESFPEERKKIIKSRAFQTFIKNSFTNLAQSCINNCAPDEYWNLKNYYKAAEEILGQLPSYMKDYRGSLDFIGNKEDLTKIGDYCRILEPIYAEIFLYNLYFGELFIQKEQAKPGKTPSK